MDSEKTLKRVYAMPFASVYPLLVVKVERKGRNKDEVDQVIKWLTGYSQSELEKHIADRTTYEIFFKNCPAINPDRFLIKGSVCGVKVEEIEDPIMREVRYLDKLVDELAKGRSMEKILRKP